MLSVFQPTTVKLLRALTNEKPPNRFRSGGTTASSMWSQCVGPWPSGGVIHTCAHDNLSKLEASDMLASPSIPGDLEKHKRHAL